MALSFILPNLPLPRPVDVAVVQTGVPWRASARSRLPHTHLRHRSSPRHLRIPIVFPKRRGTTSPTSTLSGCHPPLLTSFPAGHSSSSNRARRNRASRACSRRPSRCLAYLRMMMRKRDGSSGLEWKLRVVRRIFLSRRLGVRLVGDCPSSHSRSPLAEIISLFHVSVHCTYGGLSEFICVAGWSSMGPELFGF